MKIIKIFITLLILSTTVFSQENDPFNQNTGKAVLQQAFEKGYNIKVGIGFQNFLVEEGSLGFADKIAYNPNTLSYFVAFTVSDRWMQSNVYLNYEIQFGKRQLRTTPNRTDTVNLLNCSEFDYYFFSLPVQLSFRNLIGNNAYWAISPGVYFDYLVTASTQIKNGSLSRYLNHPNSDEQELRSTDFGAILSFEFGVRAAYIGINYKIGLKNLAPENVDNLTIRNNGMFNVYFGYRFGTVMGKADANKVKNSVPNI